MRHKKQHSMILILDYRHCPTNLAQKWVKCYRRLSNVYLKQVHVNLMFLIRLIRIKMVICTYIVGYVSHEDV
jgi:hypothetical protein